MFTKKHFSLFLLTLLVLFLCPSARALTRQEAADWAAAQEGRSLDLDGGFGAQCSDLASAYLNYLCTGDPLTPLWGVYDACAYPAVVWLRPSLFAVLAPREEALAGDLFVCEGSGVCGHIGIILKPLPGGALVLDQNSSPEGKAWIHPVTWEGGYRLKSLIRFQGFSSCPSLHQNSFQRGVLSLEIDPDGQRIGTEVTLLFPSGKKSLRRTLGTRLVLRLPEAGTYLLCWRFYRTAGGKRIYLGGEHRKRLTVRKNKRR